jgi:hypothetical protein
MVGQTTERLKWPTNMFGYLALFISSFFSIFSSLLLINSLISTKRLNVLKNA